MTPHRQRLAPALSASVAAHLTLVLLAILLISRHAAPAIAPAPPVPTKFVFMEQSGAIGGGAAAPGRRRRDPSRFHRIGLSS